MQDIRVDEEDGWLVWCHEEHAIWTEISFVGDIRDEGVFMGGQGKKSMFPRGEDHNHVDLGADLEESSVGQQGDVVCVGW